MKTRFALLALLALGISSPALAQTWLNPENPSLVSCQAAPATADANCPWFILPANYRGFCAYVFDNASGASTFNLDLQAKDGVGGTAFNWTTAGGASKAAANEGATCWYPTALTAAPNIFTPTADVVVTSVPTLLRIVIDKTAAVSTQFDLWIFLLR